MEPLVSVIVPVYNVEPYLRKCVDSILNQTYRNLEVILVDDGSPDNCGAICDEYAELDSRVRVIHKENGGLPDARNAGIAWMTGDYLTFVDSDDWIAPDLYNSILTLRPFDIAVFGCTFVDKDGIETATHKAVIKPEIITPTLNHSVIKELLHTSLFGYSCNKIYHSKVIQKLSFEQIPLREDLAFNLGAFRNAEHVLLSDKTGYFYLQRDNSTLHSAYTGAIPEPKGIIRRAETMYFNLRQLSDNRCANRIIKIYLTDFILKYIARNQTMSDKQKLTAIADLFTSKAFRRNTNVYRKEGNMLCFFTICYKLNMPGLFWWVLKDKWNHE